MAILAVFFGEIMPDRYQHRNNKSPPLEGGIQPAASTKMSQVRSAKNKSDLETLKRHQDHPILSGIAAYMMEQGAESRLTVDRGAYYFLTPQDTQTYLRFRSLSDLTIDLAGSKVFFAGAFLQGFALANCDHVTLTNFDIDFLEPPYTQVELLSVDPSARTLTYRALPQWRDPATFNSPSVPGEAAASLVFGP
jgi:hypothetical protein